MVILHSKKILIYIFRSGSFKGAATAFFATAYEANIAVQTLNNKEHMGKRIHCRLATETTVVGETGPVIANGSNMSMASLSGLNSSCQR
jgi:RNA recognition motif-containing protein